MSSNAWRSRYLCTSSNITCTVVSGSVLFAFRRYLKVGLMLKEANNRQCFAMDRMSYACMINEDTYCRELFLMDDNTMLNTLFARPKSTERRCSASSFVQDHHEPYGVYRGAEIHGLNLRPSRVRGIVAAHWTQHNFNCECQAVPKAQISSSLEIPG
jgi:hypothetical protein